MRTFLYLLFFTAITVGFLSCRSESSSGEEEIVVPEDQIGPPSQIDENFELKLKRYNIDLLVRTQGKGSIQRLQINGFAGEMPIPSSINRQVDPVSGAVIEDLNSDGKAEVYVFTHVAGSGSYGTILAFNFDEKGNWEEIPILDPAEEQLEGYMGHDRYAISEEQLLRVFPVYRPGDTNAEPTGGERTIAYRLGQHNGQWALIPE